MNRSKLIFFFLFLVPFPVVPAIGWLLCCYELKDVEALARYLLATEILADEPYCVLDRSLEGQQATVDEWLAEFERRETLRKQSLSVGSSRHRCIEEEAIRRGER